MRTVLFRSLVVTLIVLVGLLIRMALHGAVLRGDACRVIWANSNALVERASPSL